MKELGQGKLTKNQRKVLKALQNDEDIIPVGKKSEEIFGKKAIGKRINEKISHIVDLNNEKKALKTVLKKR